MAHVKSINIQYISMILAYIIVSGDRVEKGDVIIEVNGTKIVKVNQYQKLIRHSNPDIYFTVRKTNGKEVSLHAVLKNRVTCNARFAIDIAHNRGDGVRVTVVAPRSPARVCSLVTSQE